MPKAYKIVPEDEFNRFTVIREVEPIVFPSGTKRRFLCRCKCGTERVVTGQSLVNGKSASCGCLKQELARERARNPGSKTPVRFKHGHSVGGVRTTEHGTWHQMLQRCNNPKHKRYPEWGGRGIKVCSRWQGEDGFANFLADMGPRPTPQHSIDRKDNDGDYEPSNCRWATGSQQCNNKRRNHLVTFERRTQTLMQWAEELDMPYSALSYRLLEAKWPVEKAFRTPTLSRYKRVRRGRPATAPP